MGRNYNNPWIPDKAMDILDSEDGSILDVGGGSSPYYKAEHILDIGHYDATRLAENAWGGAECTTREWRKDQYTQLDLCSGEKWPFVDSQFDLGLCIHTLEDLHNPLPTLSELSRVCENVLVICPSRVLEQMMGADHPAYCGFPQHFWMVFEEKDEIVLKQKSALVNMPGCHLLCPFGKVLRKEIGSVFFYGSTLSARLDLCHDANEERHELRSFVDKHIGHKEYFTKGSYRQDLRYWVWKLSQKYLGKL